MHLNVSSRFLSIPVLHAVGLGVVSMFRPGDAITFVALWFIWAPLLYFFYGVKPLLIVSLGSAPFLIFAAFQYKENEPNKALERTRLLITDAAFAASAPSNRVAQLGR